jgi:hypothetical protein
MVMAIIKEMMMKQTIAWVCLCGTVIILGVILLFSRPGVAVGQVPTNTPGTQNQNQPVRPTFIPLKFQTPVPTPSDNRQVAVITVSIESNEDRIIKSATLDKTQLVHSDAPTMPEYGEWLVEITGAKGKLRYGMRDPRYRYIYDKNNKGIHDSEFAQNITVDIVVPLYDDSVNLQVQQVVIVDRDGQEILSANIEQIGLIQ